MRFTHLDLRHFGGLDQELELAPGLNVIHGPNESGKSRLASGALAALCGRVRKRGRGNDEIERFRPWSGGAFRVDARLRLANGRTLEVRQELDEPARSKVTDVELGRDVTSEFIVERTPDLSRALGLSRAVVPLTMVVRQTEIATLTEGASALQEMLQKAAAREATDATANRAIDRLQLLQSESIGTERANSKRPLREAVQQESDARRHREDALRLQREVRQEREELSGLTRALASMRVQRDAARRAEVLRELTGLHARIDHLARLEALLASPSPSPLRLPDGLRERLTDLAHWARDVAPPPRPDIDPKEHAKAREVLATLPPAPIGDLVPAEPVVRAHRAVAIAAGALDAHDIDGRSLDVPGPGEAGTVVDATPRGASAASATVEPHHLRALAGALETPPPSPPDDAHDPARAPPWLVLGCIALLAGLPLSTLGLAQGASLIVVLGLAGLVVGGVCLVLARRHGRTAARRNARVRGYEADVALHAERREAIFRELSTLGFPATAMTPRDLRVEADRVDREADRRRRLEGWRARREQLAIALRDAEATLARMLAGRDAATFEAYQDACAKRAEAAQAAGRRPDLERFILQGETTLAVYARARAAFDAKRDELAAALEMAGIPAADPTSAEARDELDALLAMLTSSETQLAERGRVAEERARLLEGQTPADLEARLTALRSELATLDARLSQQPAQAPSGADAATIAHELASTEQDLARRQGQLEVRVGQVPSLAEADEACDRAQQEVDRLRRYDRVINHAIRLLGESRDHVHRDIAPRLSVAVSNVLPRLTAARWREARIRVDTLAVSVRDDDGSWRDAAHLSIGALEQVHLALRAVLADAIGDPNEPAPLVLDDVLAHADPGRRDAILDWLLSLSESRQVLLTTTDPLVRDWSINQGAHLIDLDGGR
jgi:hypothetical protein